MLFTSYSFFLFIFLFALAWRCTGRRRLWLVNIASILFYGAWNPWFVLLLLGSSVLDYVCAAEIVKRPARKRLFLVLSLLGNLGALAFFKYGGFGLRILHDLTGLDFPTPTIILPVGISFYTFQSMSYTIDVYRGEMPPARSFGRFLMYVSFFPQLIAGPIERAAQILPQVDRLEEPTSDRAKAEGFSLLLRGFIKKAVIADNLAVYVDQVFGGLGEYDAVTVALATIFFGVQIYCDFSGYTDIARGLGRFMGIRLMENFNYPYFARNIRDFWSRWHISLSTWLRDYLYIPLGGNRGGAWRTYRNLMLTMLLGGLWHGANYNFIIWGALHGAFLIAHRLTVARMRARIPAVVGWATTQAAVFVTWFFFRVQDITDLADLNWHGVRLRPDGLLVWLCAGLVVIQAAEAGLIKRRLTLADSRRVPVRWALASVFIATVYVMKPAVDKVFIYFQF